MIDGRLINIGFGNTVVGQRVVAVIMPQSAPSKRLQGGGAPGAAPHRRHPRPQDQGHYRHRQQPRHPVRGPRRHPVPALGRQQRRPPGRRGNKGLGDRRDLRRQRALRSREDHPLKKAPGRGARFALLHFLHHPGAPLRGDPRPGILFRDPGGISGDPGPGRASWSGWSSSATSTAPPGITSPRA